MFGNDIEAMEARGEIIWSHHHIAGDLAWEHWSKRRSFALTLVTLACLSLKLVVSSGIALYKSWRKPRSKKKINGDLPGYLDALRTDQLLELMEEEELFRGYGFHIIDNKTYNGCADLIREPAFSQSKTKGAERTTLTSSTSPEPS